MNNNCLGLENCFDFLNKNEFDSLCWELNKKSYNNYELDYVSNNNQEKYSKKIKKKFIKRSDYMTNYRKNYKEKVNKLYYFLVNKIKKKNKDNIPKISEYDLFVSIKKLILGESILKIISYLNVFCKENKKIKKNTDRFGILRKKKMKILLELHKLIKSKNKFYRKNLLDELYNYVMVKFN